MPDTSFSFRALREHIRKYFWIYLVGIALCLVGTSLLWTTTRPRPQNYEEVIVYLADGFSNPAPLKDVADDMLARNQPYDDTLKSVQFQSLMSTEGDYNSSTLLVTRLAVGEADAFIACQPAMDALVTSQALLPLDDYVAAGWPGDYGLEPFYAELVDEDTGERTRFLAGLRVDSLTALSELGVIMPEGATLCVTANGGNVETTMKAVEFMLEDLTEAAHAGTEAA